MSSIANSIILYDPQNIHSFSILTQGIERKNEKEKAKSVYAIREIGFKAKLFNLLFHLSKDDEFSKFSSVLLASFEFLQLISFSVRSEVVLPVFRAFALDSFCFRWRRSGPQMKQIDQWLRALSYIFL